MPDKETVMKYLEYFGNTITDPTVRKVCADALALLKEWSPIDPYPCADGDWQCINCGTIIGYEELQPGGLTRVRHNYCPNCGAKIQWEAKWDDE